MLLDAGAISAITNSSNSQAALVEQVRSRSDALLTDSLIVYYHKKNESNSVVYSISLKTLSKVETPASDYGYYYGEIISKKVKAFLSWPISKGGFRISSYYGMRRYPILEEQTRFHAGLDLAADFDTPVMAAAPGVVIQAFQLPPDFNNSMGYGSFVVIRHLDGGFSTFYGHMNLVRVVKDQLVRRGEVIGTIGISGGVTGSHLHFEVRVRNKPVDPLDYLK